MMNRNRRRYWPEPRMLGPEEMYWPGNVAPGFARVVEARLVHSVCAERMAKFDALPRQVRDRINEEGILGR